ncbi:uncharacterized protein K452DRAFT_245975 [Aplosporella prunicola CBS 121167]|uniref:Heterokaryon incompatibility domain-containing protein n=1 Tax=Aplosporella prunicola CBS 121167 TaxID=1176127 RepID=A0A6A6BL98_9PEZI|nr:uncharacterized protein K452DRAFT_245975 [Aplosporella prunicola CBS 121167]KAF2144816.1 hypothetical protein K452DRAFT_245975 [Aplosporella prunicola CBS 121167]
MQKYLERDWKALICLLKRSWWMRTWIMQEATTANETMMAWGNTTIPFQMVLSCISMITGTMSFFLCDSDLLSGYETSLPPFVNEVFTYMDKGPMIITRISESREQLTTASSPLSILKMVQMFRPCGASDNRDKIFAPLSLFENPHLPNFVIDYNVSEKAVYQRFAESLILATNPPNLDVLGFCWTHEEKEGQESPSLPSWVPDWTKPSPHALERLPKRLPEFDDIRIGERVAYAADSVLRRMAGAEQNLRVQLVDGLLQAHGLLLAQLEDIRPPFGNNSAYEDSLFDDAETRMYTPTGTTLHEASLMTSSCGLSYKEGVFDRSDPVNWNELDLRTLLDFSDKRASGVAEVKVPDILYFSHAFGRCLASTNRGFIALVPSNARVGDQLYILYGGQVVYCLRKDGTMHTSVGECYVHGIMDGEFIGYLGIDGSTIVMDKVTIK